MSTTSSHITGSIQPVRVRVVAAGEMGAHHLAAEIEAASVADASSAHAEVAAPLLERTYGWHRSVFAA